MGARGSTKEAGSGMYGTDVTPSGDSTDEVVYTRSTPLCLRQQQGTQPHVQSPEPIFG